MYIEQLRQNIEANIKAFKDNGSLCGVRQYLSAAAILDECEREIDAMFQGGDIDILRLEEIDHTIGSILENLGIRQSF